MSKAAPSFDAEYYDRYYFSAETRIAEPEYFERLGAFLTSYLDFLGCQVDTILDAGCGAGLIHPMIRRAWPQASITAFDPSEYVCERYGWERSTLEDFDSDETFDLVICYDVLQYLERSAADRALAKLCDLSRSALMFGVLTKEDWEVNCDQQRTDGRAHLRAARWYRRRLGRSFRNIGGGLYIRHDADVVTYALESM